MPDNMIATRKEFADALFKASHIDSATTLIALRGAALVEIWLMVRVGELQEQVDRLEAQLAACQRALAVPQ